MSSLRCHVEILFHIEGMFWHIIVNLASPDTRRNSSTRHVSPTQCRAHFKTTPRRWAFAAHIVLTSSISHLLCTRTIGHPQTQSKNSTQVFHGRRSPATSRKRCPHGRQRLHAAVRTNQSRSSYKLSHVLAERRRRRTRQSLVMTQSCKTASSACKSTWSLVSRKWTSSRGKTWSTSLIRKVDIIQSLRRHLTREFSSSFFTS